MTDSFLSDIDKTIKNYLYSPWIHFPLQAPQLSPLSGAYCLIVVGEPFSEEHKKLILEKLQQGKTQRVEPPDCLHCTGQPSGHTVTRGHPVSATNSVKLAFIPLSKMI